MSAWSSPGEIIQSIVDRVTSTASTRNVYGEAYQVGDRIVVPVATVRYSFIAGSGGGQGPGETESTMSSGSGGGGGGSVHAQPIGYIEIDGDRADFVAIVDYNRIIITLIAVFGLALTLTRFAKRKR